MSKLKLALSQKSTNVFCEEHNKELFVQPILIQDRWGPILPQFKLVVWNFFQAAQIARPEFDPSHLKWSVTGQMGH